MAHRELTTTLRCSLVLFSAAMSAVACSPGAPSQPTSQPSVSSSSTSPESAVPSMTRQVPPEQRQNLADLPADRMCELISPEDLGKLAFPVQPGHPREAGPALPARGCVFEARNGVRSVVIGAQPADYGELGVKDVDLGGVHGTKVLHANDCTVLAGVMGSTLQVVVTASEASSDQCDTAQSVAQYVVSALAR